MALSATGILLPIPEELHNQLTSADRDPSLKLAVNHSITTLLPRISSQKYKFRHFISHTQDLNRPLPFPRTTANEIWFRTIIEAWEEWKMYEASRLLWHIPNVQATHDTWLTSNAGWALAWSAVKTGMWDMWSTNTEKYFRKSKENWEAKCGRQTGRMHSEYDITPPNLHRIMLPADYDLSRHRNIYNGKDIGFYTHLDYYNRLVTNAEDVAAHDFYAKIAALSSALANNPGMEIPHEVYDEPKIMYHETRWDANMRKEMKIKKREEEMMDTMMRLKVKRADGGGDMGMNVCMGNGTDATLGDTPVDGDTPMEGDTLAEAVAFRKIKWAVSKAETRRPNEYNRAENERRRAIQPQEGKNEPGVHVLHMRRRSMRAQEGKALDDSGVMQMDKGPIMDMEVDPQPQGMSIRYGLSRDEKRLKNEERAEENRQKKIDKAREMALARVMNKALNDLEVMQLDEDPFIDAPTEPKAMRDEKARKAQPKAEKEARRAERDIERQNERQRVHDEALALEMENALDDLEVMGLEDDMTSPQKIRLQARQLKKVDMERLQALERSRKKNKKSKANKQRKHRAVAEYYDSLGGYQAGGLLYDGSAGEVARREAAEREAARLEEVVKRNIEEMRKMCVDEGERQLGDVVMDLESGKTLGNKRERSESL